MSEVFRVYFPQPSRVGEFTDKGDADKLAAKLGPDAVVVPRFSREEQELLRASLRKLGRA